jgi:hypothetical protein
MEIHHTLNEMVRGVYARQSIVVSLGAFPHNVARVTSAVGYDCGHMDAVVEKLVACIEKAIRGQTCECGRPFLPSR